MITHFPQYIQWFLRLKKPLNAQCLSYLKNLWNKRKWLWLKVFNMIEEQIAKNPEWKRYQLHYPPIKTSEDFLKAKEDGNFHSIYGVILEIDDYGKFRRGWMWGISRKMIGRWIKQTWQLATCQMVQECMTLCLWRAGRKDAYDSNKRIY